MENCSISDGDMIGQTLNRHMKIKVVNVLMLQAALVMNDRQVEVSE